MLFYFFYLYKYRVILCFVIMNKTQFKILTLFIFVNW